MEVVTKEGLTVFNAHVQLVIISNELRTGTNLMFGFQIGLVINVYPPLGLHIHVQM